MHFESVMPKDQDILKHFALSVINAGTLIGQVCVLILKSNGEIFYLDPYGKNGFNKTTSIKLNDGTHIV